MYVSMSLHTDFGTSIGVDLDMRSDGVVGALLVFKTKKAARAYYGHKVPLMKVSTLPTPNRGEK